MGSSSSPSQGWGAVSPEEAYVGDGQAKDVLAVVVEHRQLLAVLQLLLDPAHLVGNLMRSRNLHVGGEASYHQLQAKEQGIRCLCGPTYAHASLCTPRETEVPRASTSPSSEGTFSWSERFLAYHRQLTTPR